MSAAAAASVAVIPRDDAYEIPAGASERENIPVALATVLGGAWSDPQHVEIVQLQGGITNRLYVVKADNCESIIVRVYGENTEVMISRETDVRNFSLLTAKNFGPKLLGVFKNGRMEEFFNAARTLEPDDLADPEMQKKIARELQKMHSLYIPLDDTSPTLFSTLDKWYAIVAAISFDDDAKKQEQLESLNAEVEIKKEIEWVKELLIENPSPVVFAHNDLLSGNILYRKSDDKLLFVDFEYGSHSFRGFDLGNHFNEYAGFDFDLYPTKYPNKESQMNFLSAYDEACGGGGDLDSLYIEANRYALASNLFWGLWAIVQAKHSKIEFDFLTYGEQRFAGYHWLKKTILPTL